MIFPSSFPSVAPFSVETPIRLLDGDSYYKGSDGVGARVGLGVAWGMGGGGEGGWTAPDCNLWPAELEVQSTPDYCVFVVLALKRSKWGDQ